ncbi:hypothetical protein [Acrocarpospora catenulata]|uniref:hypothetical protein n=1 Tax=Acrocarpospora catenulata TaxID=2836182 RepID=UPI001BDB54EF|nr:hypothetical protein [Acrocarpospora catenulata]
MLRWRSARTSLATLLTGGPCAILILSLLSTPAMANDDNPQDDVKAVICLDSGNRGKLVEVAENLGLASALPTPSATPSPTVTARPTPAPPEIIAGPSPSASPMTIRDWRRDHRTDFDRACDAFIQADQDLRLPAESNRLLDLSLGLLPVLAGGLLVFLGAEWRAAMTLGREDAQKLGDLADAYAHDLKTYVEGVANQEHDPYEFNPDTLIALKRHFRYIQARHLGWRRTTELMDYLDKELNGDTPTSWGIKITSGQAEERHQAIKNNTEKFIQDIRPLIEALNRPWRWHGDLRKSADRRARKADRRARKGVA